MPKNLVTNRELAARFNKKFLNTFVDDEPSSFCVEPQDSLRSDPEVIVLCKKHNFINESDIITGGQLADILHEAFVELGITNFSFTVAEQIH